ncbi:MAG TPA: EamA family transporter [Trebonia sp.]|jgi:drug/metabolite transporter (DMT)-like permease|nr:EamA family transporter [Trebonia sp.]
MATVSRETVRSPDEAIPVIPASGPGGRDHRGVGLGVALLSAATFGTSGTFGDGLLRAGWSPGAAVLARIIVAALALTPLAIIQLRGQWHVIRRRARLILAYGLVGVDGCTLCYFYAIKSMPVGIALLLEYLGAIMVIAWLWLARGQRPRGLTIAGAIAAIAGLALMVGITGSGGISAIGFMWGMLAAVSMAVFFFLSDSPAQPASPAGEAVTAGDTGAAGRDEPLSPVVLSWAGMCVGAAVLAILVAARAVPFAASTRDVVFLSWHVSWILPVLGVGLLATATGYVTGIGAVRYLGPKLASFIGMSEILFAAAFGWWLLRQVPTDMQFAGGALILVGLILIRADES